MNSNITNLRISEIVDMAWSTLTDSGLNAADLPEDTEEDDSFLCGVVKLSGAWDGSVVVYCSVTLVQQLASRVFDVKSNNVSEDDMADMVGELTNIIAGNIKALMPQPTSMSLPIVEANIEYHSIASHVKIVSDVHVKSFGRMFRVILIQKA
jgi:chemotaxis protein CheX